MLLWEKSKGTSANTEADLADLLNKNTKEVSTRSITSDEVFFVVIYPLKGTSGRLYGKVLLRKE